MTMMKKIKSHIYLLLTMAGLTLVPTSCMDDLLDQQPTTQLGKSAFWQTEADAETALMGAYNAIRPVFDRDYYFDGQAEYVRVRSGNNSTVDGDLRRGDAYRANYNPSGYAGSFDKMYRYLYGGVNRANYVIENVTAMLETAKPTSIEALEAIIAEARLLRGMVYFRLISMWGDVPYFDKIILSNDEVAEITRSPIEEVKNKIIEDFTYAAEKLPDTPPASGRAAKPAALAFRGKLNLYWACWNNFGWPELTTFTPDPEKAKKAYEDAAADFKSVIDDFGLTLFRNGDPGEISPLGKADLLPNYYYLFTPIANENNPELIMGFTHGGTGTGQGEELMRDFAGRSHEGSQCWVSPRYELADRYQSTVTGDFLPPLEPRNPANDADARTAPNSAVNPESYADRDWRMKATIQWDYEVSVGMTSLRETGWVPWIYKTYAQPVDIDGETYLSYNTDGVNSGYVFRKFVRNYAGQGRSDGDFTWPVMRLADVYLMYAEATNELNGPTADAIELVNKIRKRANLPELLPHMIADKQSFFEAIEQERIVELVGEGHRSFDLRRWRAIERVWGPPGSAGVWRRDTHGANQQRYFQNLSELEYQRCYIFRIPPSERDRNPNLTQNTPWL